MSKRTALIGLGLLAVAALAVSCNSGRPSPASPPNAVTVPVSLNFFARPGTDPPAKELDIGVVNRIAAGWSIRVDQPWLSVQPASGQLPRNFTAALVVDRTTATVDSSNLPAGAYQAVVAVIVEGQEAAKAPVYLFVTEAQPGQPIDAEVEAGEGTAWDSIKLEGPLEVKAAAVAGVPLPDVPVPGGAEFAPYAPGDMVIEVSGYLANTSDREWHLDYWPEGLDRDGRQVAWGLDLGAALPLGHLQTDIPADSSKAFSFHLSWSDNIAKIAIRANKYEPTNPVP